VDWFVVPCLDHGAGRPVETLNPGAPLLVLGASSAVGQYLLQRLTGQGVSVLAVSRHQPDRAFPHVIGLQHDLDQSPVEVEASTLISLGPLQHALNQVRHSPRLGRVVALSSASTLFKVKSPDTAERELIARLKDIEQEITDTCARREILLTLLKPTMIYGTADNKNVQRIAQLGSRMSWMPYGGRGLRQPVHADDIAQLVIECLKRGDAAAGGWLLGGGETLAYPAMLRRIAASSGQTPRLVRLPAVMLKTILRVMHWTGRMRDIRPVMIDRQNLDLVVDDQPARERLGWNPRPFRP
jgi:nucleoside-diphosphate-sugar epimerase